MLFYGIRGFAYRLFLYSFIVVIIHNVKSENSSSALGWYWAVYSVGIGVAGSYIPSFTIPLVGELGTLWMALIPAIVLGIFVAAFVPMAAVFPALEPRHKGAAISVYNLSAGLSNFLAPAIAVVLLPYFSTIGVVIAYTTLYIIAFFLCHFIRVEQPGFESSLANTAKAAVRAS